MSRTIEVTLVGCGAVAQRFYAPALRELQRSGLIEVTRLFDPDARGVATLRRAFPRARRMSDLGALRAQGSELAIIASPARFHAAQSMALLAQGFSVLCEKPMATTVAQGHALVEAAARASGILAIGHSRRFFPATRAIRELLASGALGEIRSFSFQESQAFRWPVASAAYFHKKEAQGGVLLDIGVHALDLLLWWFGEPAAFTYEDDATGGIEVNSRLRCRFAQGLQGEVHLSRDCELANHYLIQGTRGALRWVINEADRIELSFGASAYVFDARLQQPLCDGAHLQRGPFTQPMMPALNFEQSFASQIAHVVAVMHGEEALLVSAQEALKTLRLIEQCYDKRTLITMPWLDHEEKQRAGALQAHARPSRVGS